MGMQTDVLSAHANQSGFLMSGRTRLKGFLAVSSSTAGTVNVWDTTTAPTSATYARSGTTITVTLASHGLTTGQYIGLTFAPAAGVSATNGNYVVTVLTSSTYTVTDINSGTIAGGTGCTQGTRWLTSFDTSGVTTSGTAQTVYAIIPGEGMVAQNGLYAQLSNQDSFTVFYG
jgi:WD40 repeat protein